MKILQMYFSHTLSEEAIRSVLYQKKAQAK